MEYDLRKAHPYLVYDQLDFDVPYGEVGDCYDRHLVRMEEIRQSVRLLAQCLAKLPGARVPVDDGQIILTANQKVLSRLAALIPQFIRVTQRPHSPLCQVFLRP